MAAQRVKALRAALGIALLLAIAQQVSGNPITSYKQHGDFDQFCQEYQVAYKRKCRSSFEPNVEDDFYNLVIKGSTEDIVQYLDNHIIHHNHDLHLNKFDCQTMLSIVRDSTHDEIKTYIDTELRLRGYYLDSPHTRSQRKKLARVHAARTIQVCNLEAVARKFGSVNQDWFSQFRAAYQMLSKHWQQLDPIEAIEEEMAEEERVRLNQHETRSKEVAEITSLENQCILSSAHRECLRASRLKEKVILDHLGPKFVRYVKTYPHIRGMVYNIADLVRLHTIDGVTIYTRMFKPLIAHHDIPSASTIMFITCALCYILGTSYSHAAGTLISGFQFSIIINVVLTLKQFIFARAGAVTTVTSAGILTILSSFELIDNTQLLILAFGFVSAYANVAHKLEPYQRALSCAPVVCYAAFRIYPIIANRTPEEPQQAENIEQESMNYYSIVSFLALTIITATRMLGNFCDTIGCSAKCKLEQPIVPSIQAFVRKGLNCRTIIPSLVHFTYTSGVYGFFITAVSSTISIIVSSRVYKRFFEEDFNSLEVLDLYTTEDEAAGNRTTYQVSHHPVYTMKGSGPEHIQKKINYIIRVSTVITMLVLAYDVNAYTSATMGLMIAASIQHVDCDNENITRLAYMAVTAMLGNWPGLLFAIIIGALDKYAEEYARR